MTTTTQTPAQILQKVLSQLGLDVLSSGDGLVVTALTNVKATPTWETAVAQGAILAVAAPMQLPTLQGEALSQIADGGLALLASLNASLAAKLTPAAAAA